MELENFKKLHGFFIEELRLNQTEEFEKIITEKDEKLLHQYVEYIANRRMRAIGLEPKYEQSINTNPLPWTEHWLNSRSLQNAPQETEIESYVIGGVKQDVKKDQFKTFKL